MALESFILPDLMRSPAGVSAGYLRELLPQPLHDDALREAGMNPERLRHDNGYRVPLHQACKLLQDDLARAGDPLLALRRAHALSLRAFPLLGMGVLASATLEEGLQRLIELDPLIWDAVSLRLDIPPAADGRAALVMTPRLPLPPAMIELALAGWVLLGPTLWQIRDADYQLSLCHAPRAEAAEYQALFGCPVSFNAEVNALHFPAAWLTRRLDLADPGTSAVILQEARRQLAQPLSRNLENLLRAACFQALPGPLPEAEALAGQLGIPPRQLRQLMGEQNLRLRDLQDDVRREAALHWLREGADDTGALAQACGFSEQSAFQRAFRRWAGMTPAQWRAGHTGT